MSISMMILRFILFLKFRKLVIDMDRIGAIKDFHRCRSCRLFLAVPRPSWQRIGKAFLVFGLVCFLLGFAAGNVLASPISAEREVHFEGTYCSTFYSFTGAESKFATNWSSFFNSPVCGDGTRGMSAYVVPASLKLFYMWAGGTAYIGVPYSLTGNYVCPDGPYTVDGINCIIDSSTETALNWLISHQSAIQNVLDNFSLIVQGNEPYDYALGGLIFSSVLISTLSLYLLVRNAMAFVELAKKAARLF